MVYILQDNDLKLKLILMDFNVSVGRKRNSDKWQRKRLNQKVVSNTDSGCIN